VDSQTIRVLSLDGGGLRGYLSAIWLDKFVQMWGISGNELWKYFDVITGSSIGGIMALSYANGKSPADILSFFTEDGPWIFTTSTSSPSVRPSTLSKIATIAGSGTFYPSNTDGIGVRRLKSRLEAEFGANTMQDLKTNTIITSFEKNDTDPDFKQDTNVPIYFSNSSIITDLKGQNFKLSDIGLATSAAPLYFPSHNIGEDKYIDGGVVQNNPASFGLSIAKAIKPTAKRYCVLSIGTGLGDVGFAETQYNSFKQRALREIKELNTKPKEFAEKWQLSSREIKNLKEATANLGILEGVYLIMYLIGAMGGGAQEIVSKELEITAKYTLDDLYYYRMQYYLDPVKDTELDHSTPEILEYYRTSVIERFNQDQPNIAKFLGHLTT
jgi:patatin-like phospholipase/acyl hydrolase